jgi:hypothetical protein
MIQNNYFKSPFNRFFNNRDIFECVMALKKVINCAEKSSSRIVEPIRVLYKFTESETQHLFFNVLIYKAMQVADFKKKYDQNNLEEAKCLLVDIVTWLFLPIFDKNCKHYEEHNLLDGLTVKCKTCTSIKSLVDELFSEEQYKLYIINNLLEYAHELDHLINCILKLQDLGNFLKNYILGIGVDQLNSMF